MIIYGRSARTVALCLLAAALAVVPVRLLGQIPTDSWPTYHGDYSGRRFSTIKQINTGNVKALTLAWVYRLNTSRTGAIVGGEGPDTPPPGTPPSIKSTPLMINGILYFSVPDHVWALDARTGRELWTTTLERRGNANPMTYQGKNGKQYVAIVATDTLVVYALP